MSLEKKNDRKNRHSAPLDNDHGTTSESLVGNGEGDASNGQGGGEAITSIGGIEPFADVEPAERTGDVIKAELLAVKLRIECEQAKWDALSDELGQRAKTQHATHSPTRIGSTLYTFRLNRESKTYSLTEAKAPVEVK